MQEVALSIGEKIRNAYIEKGINQQQLSVATQIAPPKLNLIITGKRRIKLEELEVICWALKEDVTRFLTPRPPQKGA